VEEMTKKYGVRDDWDGLMEIMDTLEHAEKLYESVKESKISEGVDINESFVSIVESEDDFETETEIKKVVVVRDDELTKEIGTPQENGYEYNYWAKWKEV
jgi:H2-forming N5,N10-methylenetetrahydromethanopterin dehydrogenase-like enzyme